MNEILTKARELGEAIVESEEFKALKAAEEAQEGDSGAMELLKRYNDERRTLAEEITKGNVSEERMAEIRKMLEERYEEVMSNPVISAYREAQERFKAIADQMNAILTYYMTGEISVSCRGNCASCSAGCGAEVSDEDF